MAVQLHYIKTEGLIVKVLQLHGVHNLGLYQHSQNSENVHEERICTCYEQYANQLSDYLTVYKIRI